MAMLKAKHDCYAVCVAVLSVLASLGQNAEAVSVLRYNRFITITVLLFGVTFPILDTGSDIALTVEWLSAGANSDDYWFGTVSLSIIVISAFIPACVMGVVEYAAAGTNGEVASGKFSASYIYDWEMGLFHPILGFFLSMTELRLPVIACIQIYEIATRGVTQKFLDGPTTVKMSNRFRALTNFKLLTPGASIIYGLRLFELLGESTLETLLQTYVVHPSAVMLQPKHHKNTKTHKLAYAGWRTQIEPHTSTH